MCRRWNDLPCVLSQSANKGETMRGRNFDLPREKSDKSFRRISCSCVRHCSPVFTLQVSGDPSYFSFFLCFSLCLSFKKVTDFLGRGYCRFRRKKLRYLPIGIARSAFTAGETWFAKHMWVSPALHWTTIVPTLRPIHRRGETTFT